MGLAHEQELPPKTDEQPKSEWSFRRLFPMKAAVSSIAKNFTNPFDALLAFLVLVIGVAELTGRHVSWMVFALSSLVLFADVVERQKVPPVKEEKKK